MKKSFFRLSATCLVIIPFMSNLVLATESPSSGDKYPDFATLQANEDPKNYAIDYRITTSNTAVMAIHGGGIEVGTSEITNEIAKDDLNFYQFDGKKSSNNRDLHITSTKFDEPIALQMAAKSSELVAIHGAQGEEEIVYVGGNDKLLKEKIKMELERVNFRVETAPPEIEGDSPDNITNKNRIHQGVQLELTTGLRRTFFEGDLYKRTDRQHTTKAFKDFITAIRTALDAHQVTGKIFGVTPDTVVGSSPLTKLSKTTKIRFVQDSLDPSQDVIFQYEIRDISGKLIFLVKKMTSFRNGNGVLDLTQAPITSAGIYRVVARNIGHSKGYTYGFIP